MILDHPDARPGTYLGSPALFVGDRVIAGEHDGQVYVRLEPAELQTLLSLPGAFPFAPRGRVLPEFAVLPADMPAPERRVWLDRAIAWARRSAPVT
ncbi:MAG: hypothetical protein ACOZNI_03585 [Myxococcota bacterium]